jgi:hypothetical protein
LFFIDLIPRIFIRHVVDFAILVRLFVFFRCILIHLIAATIIILLNWNLID